MAGEKLEEAIVVTPSMVEVSVITGTLNEIDNVKNFVDSIQKSLQPTYTYELVVVDDNSNDGTADYLEGISKIDKHVRPILNTFRHGLLNSNLQGIAESNGRLCVIMDSDLQHPPSKVVEVIEKLRADTDIVVCSRYLEGGSVGKRNPLRGIISRIAILLTKILIPGTRTSTDPISGFFGFKKPIEVPKAGSSNCCKTLTLILAMSQDKAVCEIPFQFGKRKAGESKSVQRLDFVPNFIIELLRLRQATKSAHECTKAGMKQPSAEEDIRHVGIH